MVWSHPESDQATKRTHQNKELQTHLEHKKPGLSLSNFKPWKFVELQNKTDFQLDSLNLLWLKMKTEGKVKHFMSTVRLKASRIN